MGAKSRNMSAIYKYGKATSAISGGGTTEFDMTIKLQGFESVIDGDHMWPPPRKHARGNYGGPFFLQRVEFFDDSPPIDKTWKKGVRQFTVSGNYPIGVKTAIYGRTELPPGATGNELTNYGVSGWSKASPLRPKYSFAQSIMEMKDGVPVLGSVVNIQRRLKQFMRAHSQGRLVHMSRYARIAHNSKEAAKLHLELISGGYLTWEFDWLPFYRDTLSVLEAIHQSNVKYHEITAQGSSGTRRRCSVVSSTSHVVNEATQTYGRVFVLPTQAYSNTGLYTKTTTTSREAWFSGMFKWHALNQTKSAHESIRMIQVMENKLKFLQIQYGLEVTPRSLYAILPWSWLLDWCTNVGTNVSNLTDMIGTGLCTHHAYVMCHTVETVNMSLGGLRLSDDGKTTISGSQRIRKECKQRVAASPFGFAYSSPAEFSNSQWAILGALGISKGARKI